MTNALIVISFISRHIPALATQVQRKSKDPDSTLLSTPTGTRVVWEAHVIHRDHRIDTPSTTYIAMKWISDTHTTAGDEVYIDRFLTRIDAH